MAQAFPQVVDALGRAWSVILALCGQNGPAIALVAAFFESLIGLGTLFPGGTAVVLAGFAVREQGPPGLASVAAMAWLGMTAGSALDYWLGRAAGRRLVPEWAPWRLASRWRRVLRSSRTFMRKWGWWAIFFANLAGPGRASIAVASGASRWSFGAFLLSQSLAAALWSVLFAGVGYFAAGEVERIELVVSGVGLAIAIVFGLLFAAQALAGFLFRQVARRLRPRPAPASAS